uniref:DUF591 domain-containing protein n=1 Tax=Oryza sativa subsp. japonica TaxID=39947 RepID=Q651K3_ORYSJ|nr:hypothetical protein [Oryza sativa Japonica Group]
MARHAGGPRGGVPTRSLRALRGPRARKKGRHTVQREEEEGGAGIRRRTATAFGRAVHGDSREGEDTGVKGGTRGSEPLVRIHRRVAGGDESRRRMPAASKEGKRRRSTRDRLRAAGASPGLGESVPGVGWAMDLRGRPTMASYLWERAAMAARPCRAAAGLGASSVRVREASRATT